MTARKLGKLESVPLRECWKTEAADFTPWLASAENIALLGDAIGLDLEVEAQEESVGPFRADILCKDTVTGNWVLVENQLERTDHLHLGQLLTYAAGLNAVTIVWIADRFTEEHRAALDWLNEITDEKFNFFGLEIELWRIGESPYAPKFNVISKPNDWTRSISRGAARIEERELTETRRMQKEFWEGFREFLADSGSSLRPQKAHPQTWMLLPIGRSGFALCAIASTWNTKRESFDLGEVRAELTLSDEHAKNYFKILKDEKETIEHELGQPLYWHNPENIKSCRISL